MQDVFPVQTTGRSRWTVGFDDVRGTAEDPHPHGAMDVGGKIGTDLLTVCKGVGCYQLVHKESSSYDNKTFRDGNGQEWPWRNYRVSVFGGVFILYDHVRDRTFVYCHLEPDDVWERMKGRIVRHAWSKQNARRYAQSWLSGWRQYEAGAVIGGIGWAGYCLHNGSTSDRRSAHLHAEAHHGRGWDAWQDRIRFEDLFPGEWAKKRI